MRLISLTLWQRLSVLFTVLMLACFGSAAWLQMAQSVRYSQQIEQRLLHRLADHIAANAKTMGVEGLDQTKLAAVVDRLQVTNPGVELYVLDPDGRVEMRYPDTAVLRRPQVDLLPVHAFLSHETVLVLGDDPLSPNGSKAFSAARFARATGGAPGYLYAVLQGSAYDMAAAQTGWENAIRIALWSIGLMMPFGLVAGLAAFRWVTRPLTQLTEQVEQIEQKGRDVSGTGPTAAQDAEASRDEIVVLRRAFERLMATNADQWRRLHDQDQQRRELIASLSHDLRTPLASLHGYLETLLLQSPQLDAEDRDRYLRTALAQSQQVGRLASELLELARMELGIVKLRLEQFSLVELAQDVIQKMELSALARRQRIAIHFAPNLPTVFADIGMIERVLTNLLDNAIRYSPTDSDVQVRIHATSDRVGVEISDSGPGIDAARRPELFSSPSERKQERGDVHGHGLGLAIVRQILRLHGSDVSLHGQVGQGTTFAFSLADHSSQKDDVKGAVTAAFSGSAR